MSPLVSEPANPRLPTLVARSSHVSALDRIGRAWKPSLEPHLAAELAGRVVLPGLVEPHAHLDKALSGEHVANASGDLEGAIAAWLPCQQLRREPDNCGRRE